jgi:hypothetical protein
LESIEPHLRSGETLDSGAHVVIRGWPLTVDGLLRNADATRHQVDDTGYVLAFLGDADEPERVRPGVIIVAGDAVEPFLARVVDIIDGPGNDSNVHLDVLGVPGQTIDELRHAGLLSA